MKKLHRFYLADFPTSGEFELVDKDLVHQLANVLRYKTDEEFIVFSVGSLDYVVRIVSMDKKKLVVRHIETNIPCEAPSTYLIAAVSIVKRDLFELIVQKLTELGIREIVPLLSGRTIKQSIRHDRLLAISKEAVEQSGQHTFPVIHEPMTLQEALIAFPITSVVFDPREPESSITRTEKIAMYIGPEGGWSDQDIELFKSHTAIHYQKLGTTILRTETAAIVGAYSILHL